MQSLRVRNTLVRLSSLLLVGAVLLPPTAGFSKNAVATERPSAPTTLTIMHWDPQMTATSPAWMTILKGFEAKHPGLTIKTNFVAFPQYLPTLSSEAAAKTLPDVFYAHVDAAVLGRAGLTVNYKDYFPAAFFKQFYGGPIRQFTFNGKIYALPWNAQIFGLFVDTPIMKRLGLPVPQTWDQLIGEAPKIRAAGLTPLAWGNQAGNVCPDFFLPLVTQEGGNVYALDDLTQPGVSWNSPPVVKALALLQRLVKARVFLQGINGISENQGWVLAWHDKAAMLFTGSWVPPTIEQQAPPSYAKTYTVAKLPALTPTSRHWSGDGSGEGWAVNAHSPNKALAIAFIKYLYSSSVYPSFIKATQQFPSMPSAYPEVTNPKVKQMIGWVAEGDGTDHILFGQGSWNAVSTVCSAVLNGSTAAPQVLAAQIQHQVLASRKH